MIHKFDLGYDNPSRQEVDRHEKEKTILRDHLKKALSDRQRQTLATDIHLFCDAHEAFIQESEQLFGQVVFLDITGDNLLIDKQGHLRCPDFDSSQVVNSLDNPGLKKVYKAHATLRNFADSLVEEG